MRHRVERALRLLRQGQNRAALKELEMALNDTPMETPLPVLVPEEQIELAFDPRKSPTPEDLIPEFYIDKTEACICDENWEIDPGALDDMPTLDEFDGDVQDLIVAIRRLLVQGVQSGKIRRKP